MLVAADHTTFKLSAMNVVRLMEAAVEFVWWGVGGVGGGGGLHSHFHVQPNYSVEVVLSLGL